MDWSHWIPPPADSGGIADEATLHWLELSGPKSNSISTATLSRCTPFLQHHGRALGVNRHVVKQDGELGW